MHEWDVTVAEALAIQERLRTQVQRTNAIAVGDIKIVAGVDASYRNADGHEIGKCAIVLFSYPDLRQIAQVVAVRPITFPYTPGLLSFREMPVVLDAIAKLPQQPDVFFVGWPGHRPPSPVWSR